jgi:hypothetical protein
MGAGGSGAGADRKGSVSGERRLVRREVGVVRGYCKTREVDGAALVQCLKLAEVRLEQRRCKSAKKHPVGVIGRDCKGFNIIDMLKGR